ncbi:catechol 2,3-dioxygenase-like lactoylglutathione lyase family enzyme [Angulomicrobium tetraedrale]|uniref:Catechol 2,3-dioxygenase-like lactoylglutathione lyase family enzyme n=1 Tax=Ancylobacter tetraedralis TaxID=217068 RepID=A0A839Z7P4_9HYPH|nr:VOC family protein [Ancylobacter tetraedralis]MBB3770526.1 catechol 2,3-dioxygenase-like lactoylglutathione lyase family enzyme [Ancylobacter tetraedralis]
MTDASNILLYVNDPAASARFYTRLLERDPIEQSPGFALFPLAAGVALGLWRRDDVQPAPQLRAGGGEIGFKVADAAAVDAAYESWAAQGVAIALKPTDLDFGRSFVALDPDGHRLRVYALGAAI